MKKATPALRFLGEMDRRIAAIRGDMRKLTAFGERMAEPVLKGGDLFPAPVAKYFCSEFSGRAGGFMGLRTPDYKPKSKDDAACFALPDPGKWDPRKDETLKRLMDGPARLFAIGRREDLAALGKPALSRFSGFTGGALPGEGMYATDAVKPLVPYRPFELIVRGWAATGEMIAACTRAGKMPIVYMSVWLEGAMPRNAHFVRHDNVREPWRAPFFHDNVYIPPLAPGRIGGEFLDGAQSNCDVLKSQAAALAKAGRWMAEAKRAGKRVHAILVGHSYPEILDIELPMPKDSKYPIGWGWTCSDLSKAVPADFGEGDVMLHLGYGPVIAEDVKAIVGRGVRLIHTSPFGLSADAERHENFLYVDINWRPGDAHVDVPGYSVRVLPMSSTAGTLAYYAILSEMAERMGWLG